MSSEFVESTGTISVANGASVITGIGTLFAGRDWEGAHVVAHPAAAAPVIIGTVAADPDGEYTNNLELPLNHAYHGATLTGVPYELVFGPAISNGARQAAIYGRYAAHLSNNMGLTGNLADGIDTSLVPNNSLFVDSVTKALKQWRGGAMEPVETFHGLGTDGTVALPFYSFASDPDSGMWRIGANNLGIGVGAAKVLDIAAAGLGITGTLTGISPSAAALAIGRQGATSPALQVDASVASSATGVKVTAAAAGSRASIAAISSGANEGLDIDAKGTGTIRLGQVSTGVVTSPRQVSLTAGIASTSTTTGSLLVTGGAGFSGNLHAGGLVNSVSGYYIGGVQGFYISGVYFIMNDQAARPGLIIGNATDPTSFYDNTTHSFRARDNATALFRVDANGAGYPAGTGGTVTQTTSKGTGVTLHKVTGQITMNGAALAGDTTVPFVLTNNKIALGDVMTFNHVSGGTVGAYTFNAQCANGSATINVRNITPGSLSEAIVFQFNLGKGSTT